MLSCNALPSSRMQQGYGKVLSEWVNMKKESTLNLHQSAACQRCLWIPLCHSCNSKSFRWNCPRRPLRSKRDTQNGNIKQMFCMVLTNTKSWDSTLTLFLKMYPAMAAAISTMMISVRRMENCEKMRNQTHMWRKTRLLHYIFCTL